MERDAWQRRVRQDRLVFGQMNESPGVRMRVALTGLTMAEYFRDQERKDVLLFIDNIFRFVQAGSEVSTLLGRMPSAVGYQPTLANEMGELQERITSTRNGSVTSVQAVYVPADDLTDPATATTFTHLDATTVLSRKVAEQGIYPAVDPLQSSSRLPEPDKVERNATRSPGMCRRSWKNTASSRTSSPSWAWMSSATRTGPPSCGPGRSSVSWPSPCMWRRSSPITPALRAFEGDPAGFTAIVNGDMDDYPEMAFFNVGTNRRCEEEG